jgi:hypothetical protein
MTLNRMTLSIINLFVTLNLNDTQHNNIQQNCVEYRVPLCWVLNFYGNADRCYAQCNYAECCHVECRGTLAIINKTLLATLRNP